MEGGHNKVSSDPETYIERIIGELGKLEDKGKDIE